MRNGPCASPPPDYDRAEVPDEPTYSAEEVDAAMAALADPERLRHATDVVTHAAPGLQRFLNAALHEGGYFEDAHEQALTQASGIEDLEQRMAAVRTLVAEETRMGMLAIEQRADLRGGDRDAFGIGAIGQVEIADVVPRAHGLPSAASQRC